MRWGRKLSAAVQWNPERRRWSRLPLAIPAFIRGVNGRPSDFGNFPVFFLSLESLWNVWRKDELNKEGASQSSRTVNRIRQVEGREWWLWGFAVTVTPVLTVGIVSPSFPGPHLRGDRPYCFDLTAWV